MGRLPGRDGRSSRWPLAFTQRTLEVRRHAEERRTSCRGRRRDFAGNAKFMDRGGPVDEAAHLPTTVSGAEKAEHPGARGEGCACSWSAAHIVRPHPVPSSHRRPLLLVVSIAVAALTGCAAARADAPAQRGASSGTAAPASRLAAGAAAAGVVKVFFVKGEQFAARVRTVPAGKDAATVAMQSLLAGPTAPNVRRESIPPFPRRRSWYPSVSPAAPRPSN